MQQAIKTMFGFAPGELNVERFEPLEVTMPNDRRENKGGDQQGGNQPGSHKAPNRDSEREPDTRKGQSTGKSERGGRESQDWSDRESKSGQR